MTTEQINALADQYVKNGMPTNKLINAFFVDYTTLEVRPCFGCIQHTSDVDKHQTYIIRTDTDIPSFHNYGSVSLPMQLGWWSPSEEEAKKMRLQIIKERKESCQKHLAELNAMI